MSDTNGLPVPNGNVNGVGQRLGLSGIWRDCANFGAVGMMCFFLGYLTIYELPAQRKVFLDEIREARSYDERRTAELTRAIAELTMEVRRSREEEPE